MINTGIYPGDASPKAEYLGREMGQWDSGHFRERESEARKLVQENGITFNRYRNGQIVRSSWPVDVIPAVIAEARWLELADGLKQRARLLDVFLKDLYSNRECLKAGIVAPGLVFKSPLYNRTLFSIPEVRRHETVSLFSHGCDLTRDNDGRFLVFQDKVQSPSGTGYALQNRKIISRVLPGMFGACDVSRYYSYFDAFRSILKNSARIKNREPFIVMYTPGPHNESYYEHAYLANYLGITLAQGKDMEVRSGYVYLNTIEGRRQVDVILRRMGDEFMDPVELKPDSVIGIPGLMQALRSGHVTVLNPPGTGILENKGLFSLMGTLSSFYFGEELKLPQVETILTEEENRERILDGQQGLVLKRVTRRPQDRHIYGSELSREEWQREVGQILASEDSEWVAQQVFEGQPVTLSRGGSLQPGRMILRTFSLLDKDDFHLLPGGLARVEGGEGVMNITNQAGASSKDVWVTESKAVLGVSEWKPVLTDRLSGNLARVAEHLTWSGRYLVRLDFQLRLFHALVRREVITGQFNAGAAAYTSALFGRPPLNGDSLQSMYRDLFTTTAGPAYPLSHLGRLEHNMQEMQNAVPWELTHLLNRLVTRAEETWPVIPADTSMMLNQLERSIARVQSCQGYLYDKMPRRAFFGFFTTGISLEKIDWVCRLQLQGDPPAGLGGESILYLHDPEARPSHGRWEDVLFDETCPYSYSNLVAQLNRALTLLPGVKERSRILEHFNSFKAIEVSPAAAAEPVYDPARFRAVPDHVATLAGLLQQLYYPPEKPLQVSGLKWYHNGTDES